MRHTLALGLLFLALASSASAQSSSSSGSGVPAQDSSSSRGRVRAGQPEAGGSAITLETTEPLFDVAAGLNACGYDADLNDSDPVRDQIRSEMNTAVAASPAALASRDALCRYVHEHELSDKGRELAQYISLALYLGPAPELAASADETEMPPDALAVVNILPLLRTFAERTGLHNLWLKHRPQYDAITDRVHDPVTQMVLATNIYLKVPVSSYDGRRLLILVEPLLAPNAPNARIYSSDYVVVTSPTSAGAIRLDQIRHLYLHYEIEPLVYARAASMTRLTPLLKPVAEAPLDYIYRTDVVALLTECLIKAIEARTMEVGGVKPVRPTGIKARSEMARYDEVMSTYDRQAEVTRRAQVALDMRQGWVMTEYFYEQVIQMERNPEGLKEIMGQMVYGMDVGRERHRAEQITFLPQGSGEFVRRVALPTGLMLGEKKLLERDVEGAEEIADTALADPRQDHAEAQYLKARVLLMHNDPEGSAVAFEDVLRTAKTPRTAAWAHVYLGRLHDTHTPPERMQAIAEYKAALAVEGARPDVKTAAERGLKTPFLVPVVEHKQAEEELDPTGKAQKEAYRPEPPPK